MLSINIMDKWFVRGSTDNCISRRQWFYIRNSVFNHLKKYILCDACGLKSPSIEPTTCLYIRPTNDAPPPPPPPPPHPHAWCLGPWMNHLSPVWLSTFRLKVLICQLVWSFDMVERDIFVDFLPLFRFYTLPKFLLLFFLLNSFTLK